MYKRKPRNIRRFYKAQNSLIDRLHSFYSSAPTSEDTAAATSAEPQINEPGAVGTVLHASFALNVLLLVVKIVVPIFM